MNICMFSPFSVEAPSTYRLLSFAKALTAKSHNVTVVLPNFDKYSEFKSDLKMNSNGTRLRNPFQLKTKRLAANMIPYALSTILEGFSLKFDLVHVLKTTPITCLGYTAKLTRAPVVQDIDDLDHLTMIAEEHSRTETWVVTQCEKILPKLANHIIVSSSSLRSIYSEMDQKKKITEISNGVWVDDFEVDPDITLKEKYNLKDRVVVYVGSLNNAAQLQPLIFSMRKVVNERKDVSCLILGDGVARQSLQALSKSLNLEEYVVFVGKVQHSVVPNFLSISDIGLACFPKLDCVRYASNIKVFEYMASGIPVVVSPEGDLPSYVDYGRAGVITSPSDDALSTVLVELLSDEKKRRRLADHAKKHAENFDWGILTEKLLKVYESL